MPVFREDEDMPLEQKIMVVLADLECIPDQVEALKANVEQALQDVKKTGQISPETADLLDSDFFNLVEDLKYMGAVFDADI